MKKTGYDGDERTCHKIDMQDLFSGNSKSKASNFQIYQYLVSLACCDVANRVKVDRHLETYLAYTAESNPQMLR